MLEKLLRQSLILSRIISSLMIKIIRITGLTLFQPKMLVDSQAGQEAQEVQAKISLVRTNSNSSNHKYHNKEVLMCLCPK